MILACEIAFLDVGNADSIVILPAVSELEPFSAKAPASAIVVDLPDPTRVKKWLTERGRAEIRCIYLTHAHLDHAPSLAKLVRFITDWHKAGGTLDTLCLPGDFCRRSLQQVRNSQHSNTKSGVLRHVWDRLDLWEKEGAFKIMRGEVGQAAQLWDDIEIEILHPHMLFYERHNLEHPTQHNESAVVLRVAFGDFRVLLTADIEGAGLTELLRQCADDDLRCQILKVPHHGGWQSNEEDLRTLLARVNPELAVLSVGSRNIYGHVAPQLFKELLRLKQSDSAALRWFVCTQVTRTCIYSASERVAMKKTGLTSANPCAGDVVIVGEHSGQWRMKNRAEHLKRVVGLPKPACLGCADLEPYS